MCLSVGTKHNSLRGNGAAVLFYLRVYQDGERVISFVLLSCLGERTMKRNTVHSLFCVFVAHQPRSSASFAFARFHPNKIAASLLNGRKEMRTACLLLDLRVFQRFQFFQLSADNSLLYFLCAIPYTAVYTWAEQFPVRQLYRVRRIENNVEGAIQWPQPFSGMFDMRTDPIARLFFYLPSYLPVRTSWAGDTVTAGDESSLCTKSPPEVSYYP